MISLIKLPSNKIYRMVIISLPMQCNAELKNSNGIKLDSFFVIWIYRNCCIVDPLVVVLPVVAKNQSQGEARQDTLRFVGVEIITDDQRDDGSF